MKRLMCSVLIAVFILSAATYAGAKAIEVYTVEEDRVDQELDSGNRGYIMGNAPAVTGERDAKMTVINVDIELPYIGGFRSVKKNRKKEDESLDKIGVPGTKMHKQKAVKDTSRAVTPETSNVPVTEVIETTTIVEEEWVK